LVSIGSIDNWIRLEAIRALGYGTTRQSTLKSWISEFRVDCRALPVASDGVLNRDNRSGARPGEYHYEFCGFDQHGHESNRMDVRVILLP
jgi:hypothetical protein